MLKKIIFICYLFYVGTLFSQTTNSITQYSVTFTFSGQHQYGTFANGDYWIVGPVTITSITPDYINGYNGWEVNPSDVVNQGFDKRIPHFDASKTPSLPYTAQPGESVVKSISVDSSLTSNHWYLQTAVVLTVLSAVPQDSGKTVFRPPYFGTLKHLYSTTQLRTDLLPCYAPVSSTPSLQVVTDYFERVQLDHKNGTSGRTLHPVHNMNWYDADVCNKSTITCLRLMVNDTSALRMKALINYVQAGIDRWSIFNNGGHWDQDFGRKLPICFAAVMLDDTAMKQGILTQATGKFEEDLQLYFSQRANNGNGQVLFSQPEAELKYWQSVVLSQNSKTVGDPYGYIDGGRTPGAYQTCCVGQPYKGISLSLIFMPELRALYNNENIIKYSDRWVSQGLWYQDDPCAPHDGIWANYGITYGPNGNGGCILDTDSSDGIGRWPSHHGTFTDSGGRGPVFMKNMWNAYRNSSTTSPIAFSTSPDDTICLGHAKTLSLFGIDTSEVVISWNGGAYGTDTFYTVAPTATSNIIASIKYKNGFGCNTTHNFTITVEVCAGMHSLNKVNMRILPNPSAGEVTISGLQAFENNSTLKIYNMLGERVYAQLLSNTNDTYMFNFSSHALSPGVYTIHVQGENKYALEKIIYTEK